ncbi:S8 family serine peptidase [Aurantimicrobium minutum]|uniref:S8 family serine peptidase n=1 Tax=Aurantimicrobium minutum TaxID=708131 RepID=UPI002475D3CF|nr:S8 family serine peptidase [Aurantimicrobium minutum]MDH6423078.1 subtilisin family serine protease [Aurantimicrobium minutum]
MHRLRRAVAALSVLAVSALAVLSATPARADYIRDFEYWLGDYNFYQAWDITQGDGVLVSVIDSGIGYAPDINAAVVGGADFSGVGSPDGRTPVGESPDHGTLVASVLAGRGTGGNNGILGTAPAAQLLSASVAFGENTAISSDEQIANAIKWSVDQGAKVINMSLTRNSLEWPKSWDDAFMYAFEHDVVIVAAAGNRGAGTTEVGAPATIPGVLTVAGLDVNGEASYDASSQGITIGVSAPSEALVGVAPGGAYMKWSGSSGATPIVAGLVALVRAAHPELDANNVINRIIATATPVDTVPSPIYGYGKIDAYAAVTADVPLVKKNPLGSLADWIKLYRRGSSTASPEDWDTSTATPAPLPFDSGNIPGLPTLYQLTTVGVPLLFFAGFGTIVVIGYIVVARRLRPVVPRDNSHHETDVTP